MTEPESWAFDDAAAACFAFCSIVIRARSAATRSAADAAVFFSALTGRSVPPPPLLSALRLGAPMQHFFDELDPVVTERIAWVRAELEREGVSFVSVDVPDIQERAAFVGVLCSVEMIANLGRERFLGRAREIGPVNGCACGIGVVYAGHGICTHVQPSSRCA